MKIFYFSATGNSLAVAKRIAREFKGEIISIPQLVDEKKLSFKEDMIGVVYPTFGLAVPGIVRNFLKKARLEADYVFAIATYGLMNGSVAEEAQRIAAENNYQFDYSTSLLMLDNCQPQFDIAKQRETLPKKNIEQHLNEIIIDLKAGKKLMAKTGVGGRIMTRFTRMLTIEHPDYAKKYIIDENACVKCKTCEKVCPMANIKIGKAVSFGNQCACCQACIHSCPKKAIHMKGERNTERWRNPEVSLAELIEANNRLKEG